MANTIKILTQCGFGYDVSKVRKGKTITAANFMPPGFNTLNGKRWRIRTVTNKHCAGIFLSVINTIGNCFANSIRWKIMITNLCRFFLPYLPVVFKIS